MTRSSSVWVPPLSRRQFLQTTSALGGGVALLHGPSALAGEYLFPLGVASGDPHDDRVTLWTRLARDPLGDGGMPNEPVLVRWVVAQDEHMRRVVRTGECWAVPELGHSVHVRAFGLSPDRWYFYQFEALGQRSRIGRTRTFPSRHDRTRSARFALVSCQDYQNGYYAAYRHLAQQDLDFVVHVGDYIYEYGPNPAGVRQVPDAEITTLTDYRRRYALYKMDPDLQDAHAAFPFLVTFDDHEVDNNYAGSTPEDDQSAAAFAARRSAGYQAYFENMPLGFRSFPRNGNMRLFRRFSFGGLADIHMLDTRQYRTDQPCGDGLAPLCEDVSAPDATLTGETQEAWLLRNLGRSRARWNVIAQQVMMAKWDLGAALGASIPFFNMDAWDGYAVIRQRILGFISEQRVRNPIVLSGDIHSSWVADLKRDFDELNGPTIATEFVGTSISSDFPAEYIPLVEATLSSNPHIRHFDGFHRGYVKHEVTREQWVAEYYGVANVADSESAVDVVAAFAVQAGAPGANPA